MKEKMFRNCPYADINIACEHCIKYETCNRRKLEQLSTPKRKKFKGYKHVIAAIIAVSAIAISSICSMAANMNDQEQQTIQIQNQIHEVSVKQEFESRIEGTPLRQEFETNKPEVITISMKETSEISIVIEEPEKVEIEPMISAEGPGEVYYYHLTWEEKVLIAKVVYAESRGEPFEGKVAVAAVVLNRYVSNDPVFDTESIESVVRQSGAFASINWITNSHLDSIPECMEAVEAACKGWDPTRELFEDGAKYFYAPAAISAKQMALREGVPTLELYNHNFHNEFNQ